MCIAVCILHFGRAEVTRKLHAQFLEADPAYARDVFVLDNASPEPYPEAWERLPENIYWGGALAHALDAFAGAGYTHLWFCNNDAVFVSDPPYIGRALPRIQWLEKRGAVGLYSPSATSNPYHKQMAHIPGGECRQALYIDGIAPVISLACVEAIGGVDLGDNRYGYGVDVWLSWRASRAGWGVWVDHGLVLRHKYHTAAKDADGFLPLAARAEDAYLAERIGPDWRNMLAAMQTAQGTMQ